MCFSALQVDIAKGIFFLISFSIWKESVSMKPVISQNDINWRRVMTFWKFSLSLLSTKQHQGFGKSKILCAPPEHSPKDQPCPKQLLQNSSCPVHLADCLSRHWQPSKFALAHLTKWATTPWQPCSSKVAPSLRTCPAYQHTKNSNDQLFTATLGSIPKQKHTHINHSQAAIAAAGPGANPTYQCAYRNCSPAEIGKNTQSTQGTISGDLPWWPVECTAGPQGIFL